MDFKLIWTERAISDLTEIVRYYREELKTPDGARKVGTAIIEHVEVLRAFPDIGPVYPKRNGTHREVLCYQNRIFYRIDRDARAVYIAHIRHARQDPASLDL